MIIDVYANQVVIMTAEIFSVQIKNYFQKFMGVYSASSLKRKHLC